MTKLFLIELEKIYRDIFLFHINNTKRNGTFDEALEFLSLPCDKKELKKRRGMIERALRFRSK